MAMGKQQKCTVADNLLNNFRVVLMSNNNKPKRKEGTSTRFGKIINEQFSEISKIHNMIIKNVFR